MVADDNGEQSPTDGLDDAQSRRQFLRAAVVGAAGVAAAGVAGVALTRERANPPAIVSHHVFVAQIHSKP